MTRSALCIARAPLGRTTGFELARACSWLASYGGVTTRYCLFERLRARWSDRRFLLYPYNESGAAQLEVAPDETPNAAPGGRAASCSARRTASRRLQTLNVNTACIAASGAPLRRGAPECGSRVNLDSV